MDLASLFRPGIRNIRPYTPGKPVAEVQRELGLASVVKLASNENPEGPLPEVLAAIAQAARGINRYPDAAAYDLTRRLAAHLDVDPRSLILGNGSNEVIDMLVRALVSPGETVVYSEHSFIVYEIATRAHFECGRPVAMGPDDRHDLDAMAAAVDATTKLVIICAPNNPTGTYNTAAEFARFLDAVPPHVVIAIDEAYYEYVTADDYPQTLPMLKAHPNLVLLRTFSKIHSLAGLRVGYGIGHPDLVGQLQKTREPFNVGMISQAAAVACLDHWDQVPGRRERNREQRTWLEGELAALGFANTPSQANFILTRTPRGEAAALVDQLLRKGVIVRPMGGPWAMDARALRISVGLPEENRRCVAALKEIFA
ncbi:MAG TPA: histidinol-phosphate transaminase [Candidatus Krumholzibacteria bacterium]|nr:histidinol-phosphate transaminase [Candidatus Krumholzibacteria bacterium]